VRFKIFKQSVALLIALLAGIFTLSYTAFPGSFLQYNPAEQWSNYFLTGGMADSSAMELPEYSESGAVLFFPDDEPMPKTSVTVITIPPSFPRPDEVVLEKKKGGDVGFVSGDGGGLIDSVNTITLKMASFPMELSP